MSETAPSVSIVVPTHDRPAQLRRCLRAIAALEYPRSRLEVVVVDDGGCADLAPVVSCLAEDISVRLLRLDHGGPSAARNAGIESADGTFVAFTDDDCEPAAGWVRALAARLLADPSRMVGGRTLNALGDNPYAATSQLVADAVYAHFNHDRNDPRFFASNNLAAARDELLRIGAFDARFLYAEDRELCDRWRHCGGALAYAEEAAVYHSHVMRLSGFVRQHFGYGRGASMYHALRRERGSGRLRDDVRFHLDAGTWRCLAQGLPARRKARGVSLLAVSQAANAAGFFWHRVARRHELRVRTAPAP